MAAASSIFAWEGKDKSGRKTRGEITSTNATIAKTELRKQGITATKVSKKGGGLAGLLNAGKKVTPGGHSAIHSPTGDDDEGTCSPGAII